MSMLSVNDLRQGIIYEENGILYRVQEYHHQKIGRGGGTVIVKVRNLTEGSILRKTYKSSAKVDEVRLTTIKAQFLYRDSDSYVFMNSETYEQYPLGVVELGDSASYLRENLPVTLRFYKQKIVDIELPIKVVYSVVGAPPDIRGDTAQGGVKEVKLENGLAVKVPMFIKQGDKVVIDTRDGRYVERAT